MTHYILIPVFNEERNLDLLAQRLKNSLPGTVNYFVFVDDNSTDRSVEKLKELFNESKFVVLEKKINKGPGDSFNMGFEWILENSHHPEDVIITMEADNTSDISILPDMVAISNLGYDLVLSSVYAQGGGFVKTTFFRMFASFFANLFFRSFFGIKVHTLSSFYRVYHLSLIKKLKANYNRIIDDNGFISMLEILLKSIKAGVRIIEVPMILRSDLRKDKTKMKIGKTIFSYLHFFFFYKKTF